MRKFIRRNLRKIYGNRDFNNMWENHQREKYKKEYFKRCMYTQLTEKQRKAYRTQVERDERRKRNGLLGGIWGMIYGKINTEFKDDIQLVSAYRAIDGELFSTEKEAREHSYSIKVLSDTKKVVSSMLTYQNFNKLTLRTLKGRTETIDFLAELIIKDNKSIVEALQGGLEYESYEDK